MSEESLNTTPHNHSNSNDKVHTHSHANGTPDTASHHAHEHSHSHTHSPAEMRKIVNRLSRSIGHLEAVKRMIENGQDCSDVLIQLAAVKAEINNAGKALLKEHLEHCIVEAVEEQDKESIEKVNKAIDQFIR
ncbi:metal-sensing transcriptional repressor [Porcincola intestinalis]|nr:metal-sensing transcriptional repressor [Porcincola intestinalis]MCI6766979.1 metal-sensing transcriptional repressor [Lachnospiraceae bacterium]MDD7060713.1 metal-sensing transcriptional repressor [Porcincola intestinalis]